jgi:tetratricopeptide (TPR) repeat protein
LYLSGRARLFRWTRTDVDAALSLFKSAIEVAPDFGQAHAMAAYCHVQRRSFGSLGDRLQAVAEAEGLAGTAIRLLPNDPAALAMAAHTMASVVQDLDQAFSIAERAIAKGPLSANPHYVEGWLYLFIGQPEKAIERLTQAARLIGSHPMAFKVSGALSYACFLLGRFEDGARYGEAAVSEQPTYLTGLRGAAANRVLGGDRKRGISLLRRMRSVDPALRVSDLGQLLPFQKRGHLDKWATALRWAGLPD